LLESAHLSAALISGMSNTAPEVTVEVLKVRRNLGKSRFELELGNVLGFKNWDAKHQEPKPGSNN